MTKISMVVFDMAGTTVDEGKIVYQSVQESLRKINIDYPLHEVYEQIGGMNKKEGIRKLANMSPVPVTEDMIDKTTAEFLNIVEGNYRTNEAVVEMRGASALFRSLQKLGIRVVLDTGYFRRTADILIDKMGWLKDGLIDYSVTSDEVEEGRPAPLMIRKAMRHFGIQDAKSVAKVGDTVTDIEEGINAGCSIVIGITHDTAMRDKLFASGANNVVEDLDTVLKIITNSQ
jgi:phosphonatase-like hydrolase